MIIGYIFLSLMVLLTSTSQYFIKKGSSEIRYGEGIIGHIKSYMERNLFIGGVLIIGAPVFYILALRHLDLSTAYFFTSMNIILITLIGKISFGEKIVLPQWVGIGLIIMGIIFYGL